MTGVGTNNDRTRQNQAGSPRGSYGMRRTGRLLPVALVAGLVAAACGPAGDEAGTPAAEQDLVVGAGEDPWVDAESNRKRIPNYPLNADVCETLVQLGTDYELEPMLATDWELVDDTTFRFALNDDAHFADGRELAAEDVEYSLDYTVEEPQIGFSFLDEDSIEVVDERTVDVTPEMTNLRLVEQINHPTYSVLTPGDDPLNDHDVTCTGPFEVTSYTPEEELVVQRNEDYWGEPAELDSITFRFYPDDTTRVLALQSGEVDLITDVPQATIADLEDDPTVDIEQSPVGNVSMMYVSRRDADGNDTLLADPDLRRAVAASIDQQAYVEGVLDGNAEVVDMVSPPGVFGEFAELVQGIDYDPAEAERLLDEAGWTREGDGIRSQDGEPLELDIIFARVDLTAAEFVQAQLREVGIDGQIEQLDDGAYRDAAQDGDFDLDISQPSQNDANPAFLLDLRWTFEGGGMNPDITSPGPDTEYQEMVEQARVATDPAELQRLAAEAMAELVEEEVGGIPLSGNYRTFAMRENVEGVQIHPSGTNQRWSTVFLSE